MRYSIMMNSGNCTIPTTDGCVFMSSDAENAGCRVSWVYYMQHSDTLVIRVTGPVNIIEKDSDGDIWIGHSHADVMSHEVIWSIPAQEPDVPEPEQEEA